jgi:hypothetical protein
MHEGFETLWHGRKVILDEKQKLPVQSVFDIHQANPGVRLRSLVAVPSRPCK